MKLSTDLPQRIQDKIRKRESGCWEWTAAKSRDGYGRTSFEGRQCYAHRAVYWVLVGPIEKPTLDHLCRNRACCRPSHLRQATQRENLLAPGSLSTAKKRADKTHCPQGHEYVSENTYVRAGKRHCRACGPKHYRVYRAKNHDEIDARAKARRAADPEKIRAYDRARRAADPEKFRARERACYAAKISEKAEPPKRPCVGPGQAV